MYGITYYFYYVKGNPNLNALRLKTSALYVLSISRLAEGLDFVTQ